MSTTFFGPGPLYIHHLIDNHNNTGENGPREVKAVALCHIVGLSDSKACPVLHAISVLSTKDIKILLSFAGSHLLDILGR